MGQDAFLKVVEQVWEKYKAVSAYIPTERQTEKVTINIIHIILFWIMWVWINGQKEKEKEI